MKKKFISRLKAALFVAAARSVALPSNAAPGCEQIPLDGNWFSGFRSGTLAALASTQLIANMTKVAIPLLVIATMVTTTRPARADGTKTGSWSVNFADNWSTFGWSGSPEKGANGTRSWSGTDTTFTGQGGWFSSVWNGAGGNWIPDIGRAGSSAGPLNKMVQNYNVQWNGTGVIIPNGSTYTFGLKFNLADAPGWKDYDMTTSYEAYIVTHTNKTSTQRSGKFIGTVTTPGDPVPYDCYVATAEWRTPSFIQLYAFRKENTWSGPVNVQALLKFWEEKSGTSLKMSTWYMSTGMTIAPETFDTAGAFRLENIRIPALNTLLPLPKPTPKPTPPPAGTGTGVKANTSRPRT